MLEVVGKHADQANPEGDGRIPRVVDDPVEVGFAEAGDRLATSCPASRPSTASCTTSWTRPNPSATTSAGFIDSPSDVWGPRCHREVTSALQP
ncbi:hypothetical protein BKN51_21245 [Amycolatopsis sp. BJA-103]|nr:hypothetical protein BKN51_21245 [Amycolatopsis sp. BJA-103]